MHSRPRSRSRNRAPAASTGTSRSKDRSRDSPGTCLLVPLVGGDFLVPRRLGADARLVLRFLGSVELLLLRSLGVLVLVRVSSFLAVHDPVLPDPGSDVTRRRAQAPPQPRRRSSRQAPP